MMLRLDEAVACLKAGGVIAYPTEAVFGLGCSPLDEKAVMKVLALKSRPVEKGLILIADTFERLKPYIDLENLSEAQIQAALDTWPGPFTWVFPASSQVPTWIKGSFDSVAIRVIQHTVATPLCEAFGEPLVSTSANKAGEEPARDVAKVLEQFPKDLEGILAGVVDPLRAPSQIRDVRTGVAFRL